MNEFADFSDQDLMAAIRTLIRNPEKKILINKLVTSVIEILSLDPYLAKILHKEDISVIIATIFGQNSIMESTGQEGLITAYQDIYLLAHVIIALAAKYPDKYTLTGLSDDFQNALELATQLNATHSDTRFYRNLEFVEYIREMTAA